MAERLTYEERKQVERAYARWSEQGWGLALGAVGGIGLFVATAILIVRGGPEPGRHLQLLSVYLPGYSISWIGAFIGFFYAFFLGYGAGRTIGTIYNKLTVLAYKHR